MTIAIDFDGTVVTHDYPTIGEDVGAEPVLKELVARGHRLILHTMRHGRLLTDAEKWFRDRKIPLYAVNDNPSQHKWTESPKILADLYIDDSGIGTPLKFFDGCSRPAVDWVRTRKLLVDQGFLND